MENTTTLTRREPGGCGLIVVMALVVAAGILLASTVGPGLLTSAAAPAPALADDRLYVSGQVALAQQVVVDDYSHAAVEHPQDMPTVRRCLDDSGTYKQDFRTPDPKRFLRICWDGKTTIIFQIIDRVGGTLREATAYIKNGFSNPTDVVNYIIKVGYFRIKGGL